MNRRDFVSICSVAALMGSTTLASARGGPGIGLIFVGAGSCPYCPIIAPVLWNLAQEVNIPIMLASMDRNPVAPFMEFQDGLSHPLTRDFADVPHILIWNAKYDQVTHKVSGFRNPRHFFQLLASAMKQAREL